MISGPDLAVEFYRLNAASVEMIGDFVTSLTKMMTYLSCNAKTISMRQSCFDRKWHKEKKLACQEDKFFYIISYCALCDGHFYKGQDILGVVSNLRGSNLYGGYR